LGSVEVGEAETILVATIQSRSFDFGLDQVRGAELAIADFGPISNRDVELVVMDDSECDPVQGVAAAVAIASQAKVTGVLGPSCSRVATEVSPILSEAGLVLLSASASIPELTSDLRGNQGTNWSPGFYRTFYNDLRFAVAGAVFMFEELELSNVAVVHTPDDYSKGLAGSFAAEFEELGGTIHPIEIPGDASDLRSFLTDLERVGPDGIFLVGSRPMADLFVTQSADREDLKDLPIVGGPSTAVEDFLTIPETEGMYFTRGVFEFPDVVSFNETTISSLESLYRQTYGERPATDFYAYAYDATMLLLTSINKIAVEEDGLLLIDRDALRDALTSITSLGGVTGSITCDQFGDCGPEKTVIVQNTKPTRPDAGMTNIVWEHPPASN
jgi:branched-chain amino acid transport system substrate-binding protein